MVKLTPGLNFIIIICTAFTLVGSKSVKIQSSSQYLFTLLGYMGTKVALRTLMKLTPVVNFTNILRKDFAKISFQQKITNTNCEHRKDAQHYFVEKCTMVSMVVKLIPVSFWQSRNNDTQHGQGLVDGLCFFENASCSSSFAVVNYINILRKKFLYIHRFGSFYYVHVTRYKLP